VHFGSLLGHFSLDKKGDGDDASIYYKRWHLLPSSFVMVPLFSILTSLRRKSEEEKRFYINGAVLRKSWIWGGGQKSGSDPENL
jgi:hypothetical protein